jgi:uncharacterized membrane protein YhhN
MWNRVIAVLVAIAVTAATEHGLGLGQYQAFLSGLLAYFVVHYIWYAIQVRRQMKLNMAELTQTMARRGKNSN